MANTQPVFDEHTDASERARQYDAIAWAIALMWVGIAMLTHLPWGWFLLGIGGLITSVQLARWRIGAHIDAFWVVCGSIMLVGSLLEVLHLSWPLAAFVFIAAGGAMLAKALGLQMWPKSGGTSQTP